MAVIFIGFLGQSKEVVIRLISLLFFGICIVDPLLIQLVPCY